MLTGTSRMLTGTLGECSQEPVGESSREQLENVHRNQIEKGYRNSWRKLTGNSSRKLIRSTWRKVTQPAGKKFAVTSWRRIAGTIGESLEESAGERSRSLQDFRCASKFTRHYISKWINIKCMRRKENLKTSRGSSSTAQLFFDRCKGLVTM